MPRDERSARYSHDEQRKATSPHYEDGMDTDVYVELRVNPARSPRNAKQQHSSQAGGRVTEESFMDDGPEALSTAATTAPPRLLASMFSRASWVAQASQYALTEGGMALTTACVLFSLSVTGFVTLYFSPPSHSTEVFNIVKRGLENVGDEMPQALLDRVMPEVLVLLQVGLQVMIIPAMFIGLGGVFVLGSPDRRRPGCWLTTYGCAAVVLGLALLYLLLRVLLSGSMHGLGQQMNESLFEVWGKATAEAAPCQWEDSFACSGYHYCCVTNTSELADDEAWKSLCFATLPNGTAVLRDGTDITPLARAQCGDLRLTEAVNASNAAVFTTACSIASASAEMRIGNPTRLASCENYVVGQLTLSVAFALCLVLGMSVCSLVSGVVAIISNLQRTRTSDFMPVNNPAAVVSENAVPMKGRN